MFRSPRWKLSAARGLLIVSLTLLLVSQTRAQAPAPGAPPAPADVARLELAQVEQRLGDLSQQRAQHRLTGPISLMAVGGATAIASAFVLYIGFLLSLSAEDRHTIFRYPEAKLLLATTLAGGALAGGGGIWLSRVLHRRKEFNPEIRALKKRQRELTPLLSPQLSGQAVGLSVRGVF